MLRDYWEMFIEGFKKTLKSRVFWLGIVCTAFLAILVVRLYNLQILNGAAYYESYVDKTKNEILTSATRGNIYDRNGTLLAGNEVTYNVTIKDTNAYTKTDGKYNEMLLRLVKLLEKYEASVVTELPIIIDENGEFAYSGTDSSIRQLIRDTYGTSYIEKQADKGVDVYSFDAPKVMERLMTISYGFTSKWEGYDKVSKEDALSICNIRYAMRSSNYSKYKSTVICSDASDELKAAILENQDELLGVEVEESEKRVYPDGIYFSNILGYTGKPSTEELETLQLTDDSYEATDMVGKAGLEQYYEEELSGTKGVDTVYLNNVGLILETIDSVPSVKGNDIYLTIDHDLTIATYNLIEQQLARVLVSKLTIDDFEAEEGTLAENFKISIKDVYYQFFYNNILDFSHFYADDASSAERLIAAAYDSEASSALDDILSELEIDEPNVQNQLTDDMKDYMTLVYDFLRDKGVIVGADIDTSDETFKAWKADETSLREFIEYAISKSWVDSSKLEIDAKYSDSSEVYTSIISYCRENLSSYDDFRNLVFKKLINNEQIEDRYFCLALIDQGVVEAADDEYKSLEAADREEAFNYIRQKINNIELTPAQLALDPCSGSAVITDTDTGDILALVSYPGYDINKLSGTVDSEYWAKLINDKSEPLYDKATQVRSAPGSTFKLVTAVAGLEEGVISPEEYINCTGIFDKLDNPRCWIARHQEGGMHGLLNTVGAIAHSCNLYFYETGYRLSLNDEGEYDASLGLEKLKKYAQLFGFGEKTGIEITENVSQISTEYPVSSAIGQGTNNMTLISDARYVTAIASKGTLYEYKLLDKVYDADGSLVKEVKTEDAQIDEIDSSVWDLLHQGMYSVTHGDGTTVTAFEGLQIDVCGKSGSTQENLLRPDHALFLSFGPYDDPEISVAVSIPHGYEAYNAAVVSRYIYQYYFGYTSMDSIIDNSYDTVGGSISFSD